MLSTDTIATAPALPAVDISGRQGDHFRILLAVTHALDQAGQRERGSAFWIRAMRTKDCASLIRLAREYVEVRA